MMPARFAIGIDLGTSNSALAGAPLDGSAPKPEACPIYQFNGLDSAIEDLVLPSFLCLLNKAERRSLRQIRSSRHELPATPKPGADKSPDNRVVGRFARDQSVSTQDRVIHSAKSWLCHSGVDREAPMLPWSSDKITPANKLSPVETSAHFLDFLRFAWNRHQSLTGLSAPFDEQAIVVTVPASFDAVACKLTLDAAQMAGYPESVRLLEEPQAALYSWLSDHKDNRLWELLHEHAIASLLVCDIGGGTTDFSLFEVQKPRTDTRLPRIRRIAVSEHILLGGDNVDLAMAHRIESSLLTSHSSLHHKQWFHLVAQCRDLKEKVLRDQGLPQHADTGEQFRISLAEAGSNLFGSTRSAEFSRADICHLIEEGFFPRCGPGERPQRAREGLRETGLPYAADTAITRHLADFLDGRPVHAILFNGGSLTPRFLRRRLMEIVTGWQHGKQPIELENRDYRLAVARGAAAYGWYRMRDASLIDFGAAQSIYIEAHVRGDGSERSARATSESSFLCVLPRGTPVDQPVRIENLDLRLLVNQPVQFRAAQSARDYGHREGDSVSFNSETIHLLPPLQTIVSIPQSLTRPANNQLSVTLEANLSPTGRVQLACVNADPTYPDSLRWQLDFNLRQTAQSPGDPLPSSPGRSPEQDYGSEVNVSFTDEERKHIESASQWIRGFFAKDSRPVDPRAQVRSLMNDLERVLERKRKEWDRALIRELWVALSEGVTRRNRSIDHECTWLAAAGFLLRPGYGAQFDEHRIDELWRLHSLGLGFPKENRVLIQYWILWRRTAGGLDRNRQEALAMKWLPVIRRGSQEPAPELVRMIASLERLDATTRNSLVTLFSKRFQRLRRGSGDHYCWALARLLTRTPLYAEADKILSTDAVATNFDKLASLDWRQPRFRYLNTTFSLACRMTALREHDVASDLRRRVLAKLRESGARPEQVAVVEKYAPLQENEKETLFGESLPAGLILA